MVGVSRAKQEVRGSCLLLFVVLACCRTDRIRRMVPLSLPPAGPAWSSVNAIGLFRSPLSAFAAAAVLRPAGPHGLGVTARAAELAPLITTGWQGRVHVGGGSGR